MAGFGNVKLKLPDDDYCQEGQLRYSTMENDFQRANELIHSMFGDACKERSILFSRAGMPEMEFPVDFEDYKWWISIAMSDSDIRSSNEMLHHGGCLMVSFPQRLWTHCMDRANLGSEDSKKRGSVAYLIVYRDELFPHQLRREASDRIDGSDTYDVFRAGDMVMDLSCARSSDVAEQVSKFCNSKDFRIGYPDLLREVDGRALRRAIKAAYLLTSVARWSVVDGNVTAHMDPVYDSVVIDRNNGGEYNRLFVQSDSVLTPCGAQQLLRMNKFLTASMEDHYGVQWLQHAYEILKCTGHKDPLVNVIVDRSHLPDDVILCNHVSRQQIVSQGKRFSYTMDVLEMNVFSRESAFVTRLVADFKCISKNFRTGDVVRVGASYYVSHDFYGRRLLFDSPELWFIFCRHRSANAQYWLNLRDADPVTITNKVEGLTNNSGLKYNKEQYCYEFERAATLQRGCMEHMEDMLSELSDFMTSRMGASTDAVEHPLALRLFQPKFRLSEEEFHVLLSKCGRCTSKHRNSLFYSSISRARSSPTASPEREDPSTTLALSPPPSSTESRPDAPIVQQQQQQQQLTPVSTTKVGPVVFRKELVIINTNSEDIRNRSQKSRKRKSMEPSDLVVKNDVPVPKLAPVTGEAVDDRCAPCNDSSVSTQPVVSSTTDAIATPTAVVYTSHECHASKIQRTDSGTLMPLVDVPLLTIPAMNHDPIVGDTDAVPTDPEVSAGSDACENMECSGVIASSSDAADCPISSVSSSSPNNSNNSEVSIDPANVSSCSYSAASFAADHDDGLISSAQAVNEPQPQQQQQQYMWSHSSVHDAPQGWSHAQDAASASNMPITYIPTELEQASYNNAGTMQLIAQQCNDQQLATMAYDAGSMLNSMGSLMPVSQAPMGFDGEQFDDVIGRLLASQRQINKQICSLQNSSNFVTQVLTELTQRMAAVESRFPQFSGATV